MSITIIIELYSYLREYSIGISRNTFLFGRKWNTFGLNRCGRENLPELEAKDGN